MPGRIRVRYVLAILFFSLGLVVAWQLIPPRPRAVFDPGPMTWPDAPRGIASEDGKKVALGGIPAVTVWDVERRQQIASLPGQWLSSKPEKMRQTWPRVFSPDGSKLVTMYWESGQWHLVVWDLKTGMRRKIFSGSRFMSGMQFSPDNRTLFIQSIEPVPLVSWKFFLSAWDLASGERRIVAMSDRTFYGFALSRDGRHLAFGTIGTKQSPGHLFLWDLVEGKQRAAIPAEEWNQHLAFTPDGQSLITSGWGHLTVWDVNSATQRSHFNPFGEWYDPVRIVLDPHGEVVAIQLRSTVPYLSWARALPQWVRNWLDWETTALFEVRSGRRLATVPDQSFLAFAEGGRALLTFSGNGTICWWNMPPERPYLLIASAAFGCGVLPFIVPFMKRFSRVRRNRSRPLVNSVSPTQPIG